jgi:hypothetical protein
MIIIRLNYFLTFNDSNYIILVRCGGTCPDMGEVEIEMWFEASAGEKFSKVLPKKKKLRVVVTYL